MLQNYFLIFGAIIAVVNTFPDGAPPDSCVKERFNQPNHGEARSQPLGTLPYQVVASTAFYQPGETISCKITYKFKC